MEAQGPRKAWCGFGRHAWDDPEGDRLSTSAAIVQLGPGTPELDNRRRIRSPRGRALTAGTSTLGELTIAGHGREELPVAVAVLEAGNYSIVALVHDEHAARTDPAALVDATADDLGLP